MSRLIENAIIVALTVAVIFALYPKPVRLARWSSRAANRITAAVIDGTYRAVDAAADFRARRRAARSDPPGGKTK